MLCIQVEFLTGLYTASVYNDRNTPEWPPEPARLFSAMVAAWAQGPEPGESEVLDRLSELPPPHLSFSPAGSRTVATHFVPVNDPTAAKAAIARPYGKLLEAQEALASAATPKTQDRAKAKLAKQIDSLKALSAKASVAPLTDRGKEVIPHQRLKQGRTFPTSIPDDPVVSFTWLSADFSADERRVLDGLLSRVSRLGHSSSLVWCRLGDPPKATLVPDSTGHVTLRVPTTEQRSRLEEMHAVHRGVETRTIPARLVSYGVPSPAHDVAPRGNNVGSWWVLAWPDGHQPPVKDALAVTSAVRGAIMSHAVDPIPPVISGHEPDGAPTASPHISVLPLPFVGHTHATGTIMGVAIMVPDSATDDDALALEAAMSRWAAASKNGSFRLRMRGRVVDLRPADNPSPRATLRRGLWSREALVWCTVTPIALDRHPSADLWPSPGQSTSKQRRAEDEAVGIVSDSCERLGLPRPSRVALSAQPLLAGSTSAKRFARFSSGHTRRTLTHAALTFDVPVGGPLVLGAGRFLGYGLCRPVAKGDQ